MQRILPNRSLVLLVLFLLLFPRLGSCQQSDAQELPRYRAGYFATPVEIPGDIFHRKITSFEVNLVTRDRNGRKGFLIVDDQPVTFNEFGDATATDRAGMKKHAVSFVDVTPKPTSQYGLRSPDPRRIYKLVFDESFCDRNFLLNVPNDTLKPVRLLICKVVERETNKEFGPIIESMFPLTLLGTPLEFPEDEPTPDAASYSTSTIKMEGRWYPGFEIRTNLGGSGSLVLDRNATDIIDYGDNGFQTALGSMPIPTRFISKELADPLKLGRRVFELKLDNRPVPESGESSESSFPKYSMMLAAKSSGDHRLIIKRDGKIVRIIPLNADGWRKSVAELRRKKERSANALRKLRRDAARSQR